MLSSLHKRSYTQLKNSRSHNAGIHHSNHKHTNPRFACHFIDQLFHLTPECSLRGSHKRDITFQSSHYVTNRTLIQAKFAGTALKG